MKKTILAAFVAACGALVAASQPAHAYTPLFLDDFSGSTVDSAFTATGDATLSISGGLLHVTVTSRGGVTFTASMNGADSMEYEIIPHFASSGTGEITESEYDKDGNSGTPHLGYGTKYDNTDGTVYRIEGDGSNNDVLVADASFTNETRIRTTRRWKYSTVLGIPIGCYSDDHKIYWIPPHGSWMFGRARTTAVAGYSNAMVTSVAISGTDSFDLDVFGVDNHDFTTGDIETSPDTGTHSGGTSVTVDAWGDVQFVNVSNVKLDGAAVSYTIVSPTRLTYTTLSHVAATVKFEFEADGTDSVHRTYVDQRAFRFTP